MTYEEAKEFAQEKYGKNAEKINITEEEKTFTIHVKKKKQEIESTSIIEESYLIDKETRQVIASGNKVQLQDFSGN